MEAFAYVLILTLAVVTLFFAVAFRDPPKFDRKWTKKKTSLTGGFFYFSLLENYPTIRVEVHFFTTCSVQPVKTQIAEFWNQDLLIVVKVFEEEESA